MNKKDLIFMILDFISDATIETYHQMQILIDSLLLRENITLEQANYLIDAFRLKHLNIESEQDLKIRNIDINHNINYLLEIKAISKEDVKAYYTKLYKQDRFSKRELNYYLKVLEINL